jgi:hypothetical protein
VAHFRGVGVVANILIGVGASMVLRKADWLFLDSCRNSGFQGNFGRVSRFNCHGQG